MDNAEVLIPYWLNKIADTNIEGLPCATIHVPGGLGDVILFPSDVTQCDLATWPRHAEAEMQSYYSMQARLIDDSILTSNGRRMIEVVDNPNSAQDTYRRLPDRTVQELIDIEQQGQQAGDSPIVIISRR